MTEEIGRAKFVLETDKARFERDLSDAEKTAGRTADKIGDKFKKLGKTLGAAGKSFSMKLTAPIVGLAGIGAKSALSFETSMNKIRFLTNVTADQMPSIENAVIDVARATGTLPTEAAASFYFALSSGAKDAAQAQAILEPTIIAASMGLGAQEDVTRAVLAIVNAYGLEMTDATTITGQFIEMVESGLAEPDELAQSLSRVLAPAKALKVEFPQVGAAIAALTVQTGASGQRAISMFQRALVSMSRMSPVQKKMIEGMGGDLAELNRLVQEDFGAAMQYINEAFNGSFPLIKKFMGSIEGTTAVLEIGSEKGLAVYQESLTNMATAGEDAQGKIEAFRETNEFTVKQMKTEISIAWIELGRAVLPVMMPIVKMLGKLVRGLGVASAAFRKFPAPVRYAVIGLLMLLAAIGPVLIIAGALMGVAAALGPLLALVGIGGATAGTGLMATAVGGLAAIAPLLALAVVVGALALGIIWLMNNYETAWEFMKDFFSFVSEVGWKAMKGLHEGFVAGAKVVLRSVKGFVETVIGMLNPYNWKVNSTLPQSYRKIMRDSAREFNDEGAKGWVESGSIARGGAMDMVLGIGDELGELPGIAEEVGDGMGAALAGGFSEALTLMRDQIDELHGEVQRLGDLDTVESVAEDLERAVLELEALDLESAAEAAVKAREAEIESINDKVDALREEKSAMDDSLSLMKEQGLMGKDDLKNLEKQMKARKRGIDNEVKALESRRKEVRKQRTPEEKRLEQIDQELKQLGLLGRRRDLERELLELRNKTADKTLTTDQEILTAMENMIPTIASVTDEINKQANDLWTTFIPAWDAASGGGAGGGGLLDEQIEFMKGLEEFDMEDFTPDFSAMLDEAKEQLLNWFDDNKFKIYGIGLGMIAGGIIGGMIGGPIGIGAGAIIGAGLGAVVGGAMDNWGGTAWKAIKGFFSTFVPKSTGSVVAAIVGGLLGAFIAGPAGIPVGAALGARFGTTAVRKSLNWIGSAWDGIKGYMSKFVPKSVGSVIAGIAGGIIGGLIMGPLGIPVGAALGVTFGTKVAGKIVGWIGNIWNAIKGAVETTGEFLGKMIDIGAAIGKAIWEGIKNGLGDLGGWILKKITEMIPGGGLLSKGLDIGKGLLGFNEAGGPVSAGRPTVVGESGVELFVPRRSGQIISNDDLVAAGSRGGGSGALANIEVNLMPGDDWNETKRAIIKVVEEKLDETAARTGLARRRFARLGTGAPRGR